MRKIIICSLLIIPFVLSGQKFNSGVIAGITGSQVDGDQYSGYNKLNAQAGIFVDRSFYDIFVGCIELKYIGKGSIDRDKNYGTQNYKVSMHYLEVPLLIKYNLENKYFPFLGLSTGILVDSYEAQSDQGILIEVEDGTQFKPLDFNILIGLSYQLSGKVFIDARFGYSLFAVKTGVKGNPNYRGGGFNNNLLEVALGYYFRTPER